MVESACHNIAAWSANLRARAVGPATLAHKLTRPRSVLTSQCRPDLSEGSVIDLPFLGVVQSMAVPMGNQPQWAVPPIQPKPGLTVPPIVSGQVKVRLKASRTTLTTRPAVQIPCTLPLTPLSVSFHTGLSLSRLLLLWELVLLGEPILIFSADPRAGADLVTHLRNLIRPVLFAGDERPYLHIHDIDFSKVASPDPVSDQCLDDGARSWDWLRKQGWR